MDVVLAVADIHSRTCHKTALDTVVVTAAVDDGIVRTTSTPFHKFLLYSYQVKDWFHLVVVLRHPLEEEVFLARRAHPNHSCVAHPFCSFCCRFVVCFHP